MNVTSGKEGKQPASKELNTFDGEYPSAYSEPNALYDSPLKVLNAYKVSLEASKEKEKQLQADLEQTKSKLQDKDQQISSLDEELQLEQKKMTSLTDQFEQQQRELEMLQQKCKSKANFAESDGYYENSVLYNCNWQ